MLDTIVKAAAKATAAVSEQWARERAALSAQKAERAANIAQEKMREESAPSKLADPTVNTTTQAQQEQFVGMRVASIDGAFDDFHAGFYTIS